MASSLGSREAAREFLLRSLPRVGRAIATAELTIAAGRAGLTVTDGRVTNDGVGL